MPWINIIPYLVAIIAGCILIRKLWRMQIRRRGIYFSFFFFFHSSVIMSWPVFYNHVDAAGESRFKNIVRTLLAPKPI